MALLLSCLLWNITLSERSRQADTAVTVRQQPRASGGDARLDEEGCGNSGMRDQGGGETRLFGQIGMALHGECKLLFLGAHSCSVTPL